MHDKIRTLNKLCYDLLARQSDEDLATKNINDIISELKMNGYTFIRKIDPEYLPQLQKPYMQLQHFYREKLKGIQMRKYEYASNMKDLERDTAETFKIEIKKIRSENFDIFRLSNENNKMIESVTNLADDFKNL
jgi:hypothetical protein